MKAQDDKNSVAISRLMPKGAAASDSAGPVSLEASRGRKEGWNVLESQHPEDKANTN